MSSISANTGGQSNAELSLLKCTQDWQSLNKQRQVQEEQIKDQINAVVKEHLFKQLKFVNPGMMVYSDKEQSLCQKVFQHLHVERENQYEWWNSYHRWFEVSLNKAINDAVAAVKKSFFIGKHCD